MGKLHQLGQNGHAKVVPFEYFRLGLRPFLCSCPEADENEKEDDPNSFE